MKKESVESTIGLSKSKIRYQLLHSSKSMATNKCRPLDQDWKSICFLFDFSQLSPQKAARGCHCNANWQRQIQIRNRFPTLSTSIFWKSRHYLKKRDAKSWLVLAITKQLRSKHKSFPKNAKSFVSGSHLHSNSIAVKQAGNFKKKILLKMCKTCCIKHENYLNSWKEQFFPRRKHHLYDDQMDQNLTFSRT